MKYRPEIDGLRAIAVLPVLLFHAGFDSFSGGFVGVDIFFVISGYLISYLIVEDVNNNRFSLAIFYERRARRILPALYVVVLSSLAFGVMLLNPNELISLAESAISIPLFSSNFYFWSERGYFGSATELKPLIHTWSLAVEEQFYLVFPLLIMLVYKRVNRFLTFVLLPIFIISLLLSYFITELHFDTGFYFPITRAWELLLGTFCYFFLKRSISGPAHLRSDLLSSVGLMMMLYSIMEFDEATPFPSFWATIPTLGAALFIVFSDSGNIVKRIFSCRIFVSIGLISYSLYLWHQPIFAFSRTTDTFEGNAGFWILLSGFASVLSYFLIEKPFRNRSGISRSTIWKLSIVGSLAVIFTGSIILYHKGFINRYSEPQRHIFEQLETSGDYNQTYFDSLVNKSFDKDNQVIKVAVIGDSFAKDFLNVIKESELFPDYSFSTRQINSECGNLMLDDYTSISSFIPENRKARCRVLGRFNGNSFNTLLSTADEIWLVSAWRPWVINNLTMSVKNLQNTFSARVRVFGLKDFGFININDTLSLSVEQRLEHEQSVADSVSKTSDQLDLELSNFKDYYPLLDAACGGERSKCQIYDGDGFLISTDGAHLTQKGAIELSKRLRDTLLKLQQ